MKVPGDPRETYVARLEWIDSGTLALQHLNRLQNRNDFLRADARSGDVHLNGRLTLGENTADNGGLRVSYMALQKALAGQSRKKVDGFTPEQRFFLGFANVWCQNVTEAAARQLAQTDTHSAGEFRVVGSVSNMPEFKEAFGCKAGQPMVREDACRAW